MGTTSLSPVLERVVKLRNRSSIQLRSPLGSTAAVKLPGSMACNTVYEYAKAQATSVEGGTDGEELVAGDLVIGEHVGDQSTCGVEVEDRLEGRGVGWWGVIATHGLNEQQDGRRNAEEQTDPRQARRAANGEQHEPENGDSGRR